MTRQPLTTRALLTLLMTATAFGALLTAGIVMFLLEVPRTRAEMSRELDSLAHLLGSRSSAALVFRDEATARENLQSLAGLPQIAHACLFTETGELLATFARSRVGERAEACAPRQPLTLDFVEHDGSRVHLQTAIEEAGRNVGAIQLSSTAAPLRERLAVQGTSLAIALALALTLAVALAFRLQRVISRPIAHVRAVVDAVIHRGDMTLRAPATGPREIGQLAVAFNRMLDTVHRQNDDLASREAYSRRLFHESQIAQLVLDEHGVCVDSNVAAADLFGAVRREALHGRHVDALFAAPQDVDLEAAVQLLRWPAGPLRPARIEAEMLREGGEPWQGAIDFMRFELEGLAMLHCTLHDVGAQRAAQAARQAQLAAEAASRAKTDFLSRMSHELRTPLNATLGFVQLVQRDGGASLDGRIQRQLQLAQQAGWHLLALIDDTLDVARIEAGKLELSPRSVGVAEALDEALAFNEAQADEAGVLLERGMHAGSGAIAVHADPRRLRQILLNLVSNAIKYNRRAGHVATEIEVLDDDRVAITIADDGLGMSAEQRRHLFEPFNRLGRETTTISGTGIGLALSHQLAQMMGGTLELYSAPDRGTRARLTLPIAHGAPVSARAELTDLQTLPRPLGACVLYIEDNPINLLLVEQCLSVMPDLRLITADTGTEGLERLTKDRPDLVLLDMQLPDMTGLDVLARIAQLGPGWRPRVVALSASAMQDEVQLALAAGAADYWTKPIDITRFVGQVRDALVADDLKPEAPPEPRASQPASAQAD